MTNNLLHPLKETLWRQFGASIDMLGNAIGMCPESHWNTGTKFWYTAYHTLFWLDYYLTLQPDGFHPPQPFTLSEFSADDFPERVYTKQELLDYLTFDREKCHTVIASLTEETIIQRWINRTGSKNYSVLELLLYNMRHVQHHTAQLNLLLRQSINDAPRWVSQVKEE